MKILILINLIILQLFAIDGLKDQYLDRESDIYMHTILCSKDKQRLTNLKPTLIYNNSKDIQQGTYYYSSAYGKFSYSYKFVEKQPNSVMIRAFLSEGQKQFDQNKVEICLVKKMNTLPAQFNSKISTLVIKPNDPKWNQYMAQGSMLTGKPAFAKGIYEDPRKTKDRGVYAKSVFEANQKFISAIENEYELKAQSITKKIKEEIQKAVAYAKQEDGFLENKVYKKVKEPAVWTHVSKQRYQDQLHSLRVEMEFDKLTQKNFDWFYSLVGRANPLTNVSLVNEPKGQWKDKILSKLITYELTFADNKKLHLDFTINSDKVNKKYFASLEAIEKDQYNREHNANAFDDKKQELPKVEDAKNLKVYSSREKINLYFSIFSSKKLGDTYRLN